MHVPRLAFATALLLAGLVARPLDAEADCRTLPGCDPLAPASQCRECDPPTTNIEVDDVEEVATAQTGRSLGFDLGAHVWTQHWPTMAKTQTGAPPPGVATAVDTAALAAYLSDVTVRLRETARAGAANTTEMIERIGASRSPGDGVRVPVAQGVERNFGLFGEPATADANGDRADPVDPVTGELVIEHDDLTLPGFGIAFQHRRTYRSRTEYDGPLGPGWDHTYNQRIVDVRVPDTAPDAATGDSGLPYGSDRLDADPQGCGPVVMLTSGAGSTMRFREQTRDDASITYGEGPANLELRGVLDGEDRSWRLTSRDGDVREFDAYGRLVSWVDSNGIGLSFTWEPGTITDWRLAAVVDSVGRTITYSYDGADRITRVSEAQSGLYARYEYDADGGLWRARRADGRGESYEYDVATGRTVGKWIPERQLERACSNACAMSSRSCDAGGACDVPVAAATSECLAACPACAETCNTQCQGDCGAACGSACRDSVPGYCRSGAAYSAIVHDCEGAWEATQAEAICSSCVAECRESTDATCDFAVTCVLASDESIDEICVRWTGVADLASDLAEFLKGFVQNLFSCVVGWLMPGRECNLDELRESKERVCVTDLGDCCAFGESCAPDSCTDGRTCFDDCQSAFFGTTNGNGCPAPSIDPIRAQFLSSRCRSLLEATPAPGTDDYQELIDCVGTGDEWAAANGCLPRRLRECEDSARRTCDSTCATGCRDACAGPCNEGCHVDHCAAFCVTLDLPGECERSCTSTCIEDAHALGPVAGPKYGYTADLQFNLIRVYDGNGALYLENAYGEDLGSPDFDTVVSQRYGEQVAAMQHVDLAAGDQTAGWAAGLVDAPAEYASPAICHYGCEVTPPDPRDVAVPWNDVLLVFDGGTGLELPPGGWSGTSSLTDAATLPPTFIHLDAGLTGRVPSRTAPTALFGFPSDLHLELPIGKASLVIGSAGEVSFEAEAAVVAELTARGGITVFGDGTQLRVYPGAPVAAIAVAEGACTEPFHVDRSELDRIEIAPASACSDSLWLAPIAGPATGLDASAFVASGQSAIDRSYFAPSMLTPTRAPVILAQRGTTAYVRASAPSSAAADLALARSTVLFETVPLFSAPMPHGSFAIPTDEVVYVFHQDTGAQRDGQYPPPLPPTDAPWAVDDTPDELDEPPCDPELPVATIWGTGDAGAGAKPAHATAIRDLHGARWTYYADGNGRLIRTVNHETGASRWMEYDPVGRLTGVLAPDGARQCLRYDPAGNLAEIASLPADVHGVATPPAIRRRFTWTAAPARLRAVFDPRQPGRVLQQGEYDARGNLRAVADVDGLLTSITLVGGTGPARAMPERIVGRDGAVTQIAYDTTNATVRSVARDATGAAPVATELESDAAGRPLVEVSPLGLIESYHWDGPLLTERTWDADGLVRSVTYAHDADAQVVAAATGEQDVELTYDVTGALVTTTQTARDGSLPTATTCRHVVYGRLVEEVSAEGGRVRYVHDGEGRISSVIAGALGPSPGTWDDACPSQPSGPAATATLVSYVYEPSGRPIRMTDARGLQTTWKYDGFGRPIVEHRPDGARIVSGYDAVGQLAWQAVYHGDPGPIHAPPHLGQPGLHAVTELAYDLRGRVAEVKRWHFVDGVAVGDGVSRTRYQYDAIARTVTEIDDLGRSTTTRADGAGRVVEVVLPDGSAIATSYLDGGRRVVTRGTSVGGEIDEIVTLSAAGAITEESVRVGGLTRVSSTTAWRDPFRPAHTTSATGVVTTYGYDAFERLDAVSTAIPGGVGETLGIDYDRDGRVIARASVAATGQPPSMWKFEYDALGRRFRETDPAGGTTTSSFVAGTAMPQVVVDPRLNQTTMAYGAGGWVESVTAESPAGTPVTLTYFHDVLGRMLTATRRDGSETPVRNVFRWDSLGNLVSETDDVLGAVAARTHGFDGAGQRTSSTIAGRTATRTFDALGRQTALVVDGDAPATARWTYGAPGGALTRTLHNGVESRYGYDALSRLTSISDWHGASQLAAATWQVPLDGVPRSLKLQRAGIPAHGQAFAIDGAGRLTAEQTGVFANLALDALGDGAVASQSALAAMTVARTSYDLDGRNNWLARTVDGAMTPYEHDARDALQAIGPAVVGTDAAGALTHDGTRAYTYDALGMLAEVQLGDGGRRYTRDGLGRVVAETDLLTGERTRYAWDGGQRVVEADANGELATTFAAEGLDAPVVTIRGGGDRTYYHQDRQGSVYAHTKASGAPALWISYTAYGEPTVHDGSGRLLSAPPLPRGFGYHGLPHHFDLGLVDMRARAYVPTLGRFVSPDPIGLAGGANLFAFVDSSPLAWRDPLGLAKRANLSRPSRSAFDHAYDAVGSVAGHAGDWARGRVDGFVEVGEDLIDQGVSNVKCGVQGGYCIAKRLYDAPAKAAATVDALAAAPSVIRAAIDDPRRYLCGGSCDFHDLGRAEAHAIATVALNKSPELAAKAAASLSEFHRRWKKVRLRSPGRDSSPSVGGVGGASTGADAASATQGALLREQLAAEEIAGERFPHSITGFTWHGLNQAISRDGIGVSPADILDAFKHPLRIEGQSGGRFKIYGRHAVVVVNGQGKVITTWSE